MALVEPLKYKKSGGSAIAFNEFEAGDQIPGEYVVLPKGYIDGLALEWVSGTQIRVTSGAAYVPSLTQVVELPAALTKTLSGAANTWYHAYIFVSGGAADVELVTTAPAASYSGQARVKTSDTSRRYIGSILTDGSGSVYRFAMTPQGLFAYANPNVGGTPFRVLSNKQTAAEVSVSISAAVPMTANAVTIRQIFTRTVLDNASNVGMASGNYWNNVSAYGVGFLTMPLLSTVIYARLNQDISDGNGGLYIDVQGFVIGR
jgi:hypothetical protein